MSSRGLLRSVAPAVLLGLLGFVLTLDLHAQDTASAGQASRNAELTQILASRQSRTNDLEARLAGLRARLTSAALRAGGATLARLRALDERLRIAAGTIAVRGPALIVRLADSADRNRSLNSADTRIQDVDVQGVVNALWDLGAEAIAVNGERVISSTSIRNAGGAVLVNYRVITSPYAITAIGDTAAMRAGFVRTEVAKRFRAWEQIYGLGFDVTTSPDVEVPAFTGAVRTKEARVQRTKGD